MFSNRDNYFGVRHIQILLYFCLLWICYAMRTNLSVAVVAMTDNSSSPNPDIPTYEWTDKGTILSSFYWGYTVPQVFAGLLSRTHGVKWLLAGSMLVNTVACVFVPLVAAHLGSEGVIGCRILQGIGQGVSFPALQHLLGKWAPISERSTLSNFVFSGCPFGTIVGMLITGLISSSWAGWPISFYFFGGLSLVWILVWLYYGADSPGEHRSISEAEKKYIEASLPHQRTKHLVTPWKDIFKSIPFWALTVGSAGYDWVYIILLTDMPNYINKIMNFDMGANGLISAGPYLAFWILCSVFGSMSDWMINRDLISRGNARKLCQTIIGTVLPAAALVALSYIPDDLKALSVAMLIVAVGSSAGGFCGFLVNHIDLSPVHTGTLMGISNSLSTVIAIIAPLVVQAVVYDEEDKSQWRIIFFSAAIINIGSDIVFVLLASGEIQYWNYGEKEDDSEAKKRELVE